MTGMDLRKSTRKSTRKPDHLKRLPFLLATAEACKEYIIEVAQAGADDYRGRRLHRQAIYQRHPER